jgi:hypothetical protein
LENCLINTSYRLIVFPGPVRGSGQLTAVSRAVTEGSWRAGGQQEGLQYNGEAAQQVIDIYIVSADEKRNSNLLF